MFCCCCLKNFLIIKLVLSCGMMGGFFLRGLKWFVLFKKYSKGEMFLRKFCFMFDGNFLLLDWN